VATTTLDILLPEYARRKGVWVGSFTTTSNPSGSAKTLTSTGLESAGYNADDDLNDHWARITSGTDDDDIRRVDDHTGSGGVLTLASGANLSSGSSITFEVYTEDPQLLINELNSARSLAFPSLHRVIHDRDSTGASLQKRYEVPSTILEVTRLYSEPRLHTSIADNVVGTLDCDFEGALTDFTSSSATLAEESETNTPDNQMVFDGSASGKITVTNGNTGYVYLVVPSPTNYEGEELNLTIWAYALSVTSVTVKAAIRTDAGTWSVGTAHGGDGWERLSVDMSDHSLSSSIHVGIQIVNGSSSDYVCYTDEWIATAGRTENPYPQANPITNWHKEGTMLVIPDGVSASQNLLIIGIAPLSSVSAGSDTMEVGEDRYQLLFQAAVEAATEAEFDDLDDGELNLTQRRNTHARNRKTESAMVLPSTRRTVV
jgi:hypothetical protein